ncbi:MAG: DUF4926 domain-containing protein [Anaerolineae bacterium]|nr:DUF4926 domain-containing protein [Anaerolineae bacterium]RIK15726.1 MAG: DUF4926 domain-containing protein [Anaerolineae bacterium]
MNIELYTDVMLTRDIPAERLRLGDVVTLVDIVRHPSGGEDGAVVELFNAVGESIAVAIVPVSAVAPLRADQMPAVRPLQKAKV